MRNIATIQDMRKYTAAMRRKGHKIAFVPTMGCLHEGHLALVEAARKKADIVVVSIFVNPTQFGPNEDFTKYPRTEAEDIKACRRAGVDAVFMPSAKDMFPADFSTHVSEELCSQGLCGEFRPGHFRGVATVVLMLFNIVRPDIAIFGQKDAQQVAVLRKMVRDLFVPVQLNVVPTSREYTGLALSSRNRYLKPEARAIAPELYAALQAGRAAAKASGSQIHPRIVTDAVTTHLARFPQFRIQYVTLVDSTTMHPLTSPTIVHSECRPLLAIAAYLDGTRLIDNILI